MTFLEEITKTQKTIINKTLDAALKARITLYFEGLKAKLQQVNFALQAINDEANRNYALKLAHRLIICHHMRG